jgi:hypothetical protein
MQASSFPHRDIPVKAASGPKDNEQDGRQGRRVGRHVITQIAGSGVPQHLGVKKSHVV